MRVYLKDNTSSNVYDSKALIIFLWNSLFAAPYFISSQSLQVSGYLFGIRLLSLLITT